MLAQPGWRKSATYGTGARPLLVKLHQIFEELAMVSLCVDGGILNCGPSSGYLSLKFSEIFPQKYITILLAKTPTNARISDAISNPNMLFNVLSALWLISNCCRIVGEGGSTVNVCRKRVRYYRGRTNCGVDCVERYTRGWVVRIWFTCLLPRSHGG